jgi:hypothetical protein
MYCLAYNYLLYYGITIVHSIKSVDTIIYCTMCGVCGVCGVFGVCGVCGVFGCGPGDAGACSPDGWGLWDGMGVGL